MSAGGCETVARGSSPARLWGGFDDNWDAAGLKVVNA